MVRRVSGFALFGLGMLFIGLFRAYRIGMHYVFAHWAPCLVLLGVLVGIVGIVTLLIKGRSHRLVDIMLAAIVAAIIVLAATNHKEFFHFLHYLLQGLLAVLVVLAWLVGLAIFIAVPAWLTFGGDNSSASTSGSSASTGTSRPGPYPPRPTTGAGYGSSAYASAPTSGLPYTVSAPPASGSVPPPPAGYAPSSAPASGSGPIWPVSAPPVHAPRGWYVPGWLKSFYSISWRAVIGIAIGAALFVGLHIYWATKHGHDDRIWLWLIFGTMMAAIMVPIIVSTRRRPTPPRTFARP